MIRSWTAILITAILVAGCTPDERANKLLGQLQRLESATVGGMSLHRYNGVLYELEGALEEVQRAGAGSEAFRKQAGLAVRYYKDAAAVWDGKAREVLLAHPDLFDGKEEIEMEIGVQKLWAKAAEHSRNAQILLFVHTYNIGYGAALAGVAFGLGLLIRKRRRNPLWTPSIAFRHVDTFSNRELTGLAGSALLLIGVFTPILSMPVIGSISILQQGWGGYFLLSLAIGSAIMLFTRREQGFRITAAGSLCFVLYSLVSQQIGLRQMKSELDTGDDNLFAGLTKLATNNVQPQWGWGVLLVGSLLLVIAAFTSGPPQMQAVMVANANAAPDSAAKGDSLGSGVADEIRKLKVLLDEGVLTPQEFEAQKKKLLGQDIES